MRSQEIASVSASAIALSEGCRILQPWALSALRRTASTCGSASTTSAVFTRDGRFPGSGPKAIRCHRLHCIGAAFREVLSFLPDAPRRPAA